MKVYIVTSGEYSNYGIERVFLNKEEAYCWAGIQRYDDYEVEEYETSDGKVELSGEVYFGVKFKYSMKVATKEEVWIRFTKIARPERIEKRIDEATTNLFGTFKTYSGTIPLSKARFMKIGRKGMEKIVRDFMAEVRAKEEGVC